MKAYRLRFNLVSGKDEVVTVLAENEEALLEDIFSEEVYTYTLNNVKYAIFMKHVESFNFLENKDPEVLASLKKINE